MFIRWMVERLVETSIDMIRPFKPRLTADTCRLESLMKIATPICAFAIFVVELRITTSGAHSRAHCASFSGRLCVSWTQIIWRGNLRNRFSNAVRLVASAIPAQLKVAILKVAIIIFCLSKFRVFKSLPVKHQQDMRFAIETKERQWENLNG